MTPHLWNVYRPEKFDSGESFCHHRWGGYVAVQNEHRQYNYIWPKIQTETLFTSQQSHRDSKREHIKQKPEALPQYEKYGILFCAQTNIT
jgi:hypothetical protein